MHYLARNICYCNRARIQYKPQWREKQTNQQKRLLCLNSKEVWKIIQDLVNCRFGKGQATCWTQGLKMPRECRHSIGQDCMARLAFRKPHRSNSSPCFVSLCDGWPWNSCRRVDMLRRSLATYFKQSSNPLSWTAPKLQHLNIHPHLITHYFYHNVIPSIPIALVLACSAPFWQRCTKGQWTSSLSPPELENFPHLCSAWSLQYNSTDSSRMKGAV